MTLLIPTAALVVAAAPAPAPPAGTIRSTVFRVYKLTPRVWGLQARSTRTAFCNGGFVITDGGVVLVDSF